MSHEIEKWKPIVGFEELYEVSNEGRVRRIGGGMGGVPGRILRQFIKPNGYMKLNLCADGKPSTHHVHRLVARAFIGECPPGCEVNHINAKRDDNRLVNLEYLTRPQNLRHAAKMGRSHSYKLSELQVREIRENSGRESRAELGRRFNVHASAITMVALGRSHTDLAI